jgi:mxaD protein
LRASASGARVSLWALRIADRAGQGLYFPARGARARERAISTARANKRQREAKMKKAILGALYLLCVASLPATAQSLLNAHESIDIKASIWKVWDAVKDFDGLNTWHPMFSDDEIKSGGDNEPGTIRTMTVKEGPSFDEELLSFDALDKKFTYKVIDPAPLPISEYVSSFQVIEGRRGYTTILWNSSFRNNSDGKMKDDEVIGFINNAYKVGLENLKTTLEGQ